MREDVLQPAPAYVQPKLVAIFDLDGTLCDIGHRLHFIQAPDVMSVCRQGSLADVRVAASWKPDWDAFYKACVDDLPKWPIIVMAKSLRALGYGIIIVSGRSEDVVAETQEWLRTHGVDYDHLVMRPHGDNTPDHELKRKWFMQQSELRPEDIRYVFEDRSRVCAMWRDLGLTTLQVCDGDY